MIQPSDRHINLTEAIKLILEFNETIQLDMVRKQKIKNKNNMDAYCVKCRKNTKNIDPKK